MIESHIKLNPPPDLPPPQFGRLTVCFFFLNLFYLHVCALSMSQAASKCIGLCVLMCVVGVEIGVTAALLFPSEILKNETQITAQSNVGRCIGTRTSRQCASAPHMRVCMCVCAQKSCFLPRSHPASSEVHINTSRALMRAERRRGRGAAVPELKACSGGWSVGSVHSVFVSVCVCRLSALC